MAYIPRNKIRLTVGKSAANPSNERAVVKLSCMFSDREVSENGRYRVRAYLYEADGNNQRDQFQCKPDGRPLRQKNGPWDDRVGHVASKWVRPDGKNEVVLELEREWNFPELDESFLDPREHFYAYVSIVPEYAMGDWEFSKIVALNID